MSPTFLFHVPAWTLALITFLLAVLVDWFGYLYGKRNPLSGDSDSQSLIEASMLGLTALLLSFTFNLSATKFEDRRKIIVEEANNIGTAILRCDLYSDTVRTLLLKHFQNYVETRIAYYDAGDNEGKINDALKASDVYADSIWRIVMIQSYNRANLVPSSQMIPALNTMIDIVSTRDAGRIAKVPPFIYLILVLLLMISAFLLGYKQKGWAQPVNVYSWALMVSLTLFVVLELDRPRRGVLNLDSSEQKLLELKALFSRAYPM